MNFQSRPFASSIASSAVRSLAGELPWLAPASAAVSRLVFHRQLRAPWRELAGGLEFIPLATPPNEAVQQVSLQTPHGVIAAYFSAPDFPAIEVGAAHAGALPPALQQLAAEALMQPLLELFAALGQTDVAVAGLTAVDAHFNKLPAAGWVRLLREGQPAVSFVCSQLPLAVPRHTEDRLRPAIFCSRLALGLALRGRLALSTRSVRRALLGTLRPGDVLLLDSASHGERGSCRVYFGARKGRCWTEAATVDETFITLQGAGRMTDDEADLDTTQVAEAEMSEVSDSHPPPDLEVPVRFEIDTVAVPLAEIEAMAPGYVIELAVPLSQARVRLVACGQVIGSADLVAVGDRLGARILYMVSGNAARHLD